MKPLSLLVLIGLTAQMVHAQPKEPKVDEEIISLKLANVGPPAPALLYPLVIPFREAERNNAALLYHRALHLLSDVRPSTKEFSDQQDRWIKVRDGALKDVPLAELRKYLERYTNMFKEVDAAARCDRCDWGIDGRLAADGIGILLPDVQKMREIAFFLSMRLLMHRAEKNMALAIGDVRTGLAMARHVAEGGTLIQFLVGAAIAQIFIVELERTLQAPDCPNMYWAMTALPRPLVDIRKSMEGEQRSIDAMIPLPKNMDKGPVTIEQARVALDELWVALQRFTDKEEQMDVAEARLGLATMITLQYPRAKKSLIAHGRKPEEVDAMPTAQVVLLDSLIRFRDTRDKMFLWHHLPYPEAVQGLRMLTADHKTSTDSPLDFLQVMLRLLTPAMEKVFHAQARADRRIASLRAVEAIRLHANAHQGTLPRTIAEATTVPVPNDPLFARPFGYSVDGNTFTIEVGPPAGMPASRGNAWKYTVTIAR